jgi:hypothetical protein
MLRMEKDGLIRLPEPTYVKKFVKKIKFTAATDPQKNSCVYSKSSAKPAPTDGHQSFLVFVE